MADTVHVKGLDQLQRFLDQLPVKIEKNVMRAALRAGVKEFKDAARANIHSVSGELAASLDATGAITTGTKSGRVYAKLTAGAGFGVKGKPPANLPIWVEYGTAAHLIAARSAKALRFGSAFAKSILHPGAKPHPFMRPAFDARAPAAVVASAEYIKQRLATKEGLDTAGIDIEVDS